MLSLIPACLLASSVDCFGVFADFSLLFCFFGWLLWGLFLFQLAYRPLWLTALALSLIPACLLGYFGWLLWGFRWFQLAYWAISVDCFGVFADFSLLFGFFGCCFGAFADSSLPVGFFGWLLWGLFLFQLAYWPLWLTALALSLIPACLLASLVDCFGAFADSSLPISFFGWLLWRFRWF